jgi:hypothetical protein
MSGTLSATFGSWRDRVTYVVAEAQLLVAGFLVALGLALAWWNPSLPGIPGWVSKLLVGWLVLAPPAFIVGLRFARWLRSIMWPTVYHVNAVTDEREKYHVPPEIWSEKNVNGAPPHRVNDGDDYEVREFDWAPEYGDQGTLTVSGTWLAEIRDAKLLTAKSHFERIHSELQDDHLELTYRRDAEDELANRIQRRLVTRVVEARENGEMLAPDDVQDVVESFKQEMRERTDREKLSDITPDDLPDDGRPGLPAGETLDPYADVNADHTTSTATDGGSQR